MNPVKIKFATSTFLLIFFYFPKTLNGFVDTCDARYTCARYQDKINRHIYEPQFLERETRMVNVRDRVGTERLVNNRRIVDSDSRISENLESRNFDFPRLAQRSANRNIRERQCDRTNTNIMRDSRVVHTAPRENTRVMRESNERIPTSRQDYQIRASSNRENRENRLLERDSRNFRDTRQIRTESRNTDTNRNIRVGDDLSRITRRIVSTRRVVTRSSEQNPQQPTRYVTSLRQTQRIRESRSSQSREAPNTVVRVSRANARVLELDSRNTEMSLNSHNARVSEIRNDRRDSRERTVRTRSIGAENDRDTRERKISIESRNDKRMLERDSRERAVRNSRATETRNDRRMVERDSREREMSPESRNHRRMQERDSRERAVRNSRATETRNDRRMMERDSRERETSPESRNDRRMQERDSRERAVQNSRAIATRNERRMVERDSRERKTSTESRNDRSDLRERAVRNSDRRLLERESRERHLPNADKRPILTREIRNVDKIENQRTIHRDVRMAYSNVRIMTRERNASSGRAVDFNNNRRAPSSVRSSENPDRRLTQRDSRLTADKSRISRDLNMKGTDNEIFIWSNLVTTTLGVLLLTQILTSSNSKKYGIPHVSSFLNGVKEKIY